MILVILGTQDKPFTRLLDAIEKQMHLGIIKDTVIVQAGSTKYVSEQGMKIFDLIPVDQFSNYVEKADVIITHAGVGSIITSLKKGKKVIAAARLEQYGEHVNNHQQEILDNFAEKKYILPLNSFDDLGKLYKNLNNFVPQPYVSTTNKVIQTIRDFIEGGGEYDS